MRDALRRSRDASGGKDLLNRFDTLRHRALCDLVESGAWLCMRAGENCGAGAATFAVFL